MLNPHTPIIMNLCRTTYTRYKTKKRARTEPNPISGINRIDMNIPASDAPSRSAR
jgi:hypothetical protein